MIKYLKETIKYLLRSYPVIKRYVKQQEQFYAMTPQEMQDYKNKRFLEILHIAYNKSSFYKKLYDDAGIDISSIHGIEDITKLPIITKEMVRKHAEEILTIPKWQCVKGHTSGTTGTPLLVYSTWQTVWRCQATEFCYKKRLGITMGKDTVVSLRGHLSAHETQLWVGISKTLYLSSYNIRIETTDEYYQAILKRKPKSIEGYPSSLYNFACNLEQKGYSCNIPYCFTSSESLLNFQREKIEKVFNTQIFDVFGTTERTIKLVESFDHDGYFETPGFSINEYVEDGEITTGLINDGFPLIRYRGYDVINLSQDKKTIKNIEGRAISYIYGKDGTAYSDASLTFIVKVGKGIQNAQLVQSIKGIVDANIVCDNGVTLDESITENILKLFDDKIGLTNIDVNIKQISANELIYTKRGKFNFIVQQYKNN